MNNGYENLGYAIIEQAVSDYKMLREAGVIIDGKVIDVWPTWNESPLKVSGFYDKKHKVVELIHWFKSGACHKMLQLLGSTIDGDRIISELGLKQS